MKPRNCFLSLEVKTTQAVARKPVVKSPIVIGRAIRQLDFPIRNLLVIYYDVYNCMIDLILKRELIKW